jgi:hypothetical protein
MKLFEEQWVILLSLLSLQPTLREPNLGSSVGPVTL